MGTYVTTFEERQDGTCGPREDLVERFDNDDTEFDGPCAGTIEYNWNNCHESRVARCQSDELTTDEFEVYGENVDFVDFQFSLDWDEAGREGTGVLFFEILDREDELLCSSRYDTKTTEN